MRLALAFCVVVGCGLCGNALSMSARRRVETLTGLIQGVRVLRVHMIRMLEPVSIALTASECPALEQLGRAMKPGDSAGRTWRVVAERETRPGGLMDVLTLEDRRALDTLFNQLGESGREQQDILIASTLEALGKNLSDAEKRAGEAERLYLSLGLLTGLMLALIVI